MRNIQYLTMTILICLPCSTWKAARAKTVITSPLDKYNVVWTTPSKDHNGSMPIGNGETGLNLWVEPSGDLVFLISRTDSWDENERLCKIGRVRIKFTPSLNSGPFKQTLILRKGKIEIINGSGDETLTVRVWVDANDKTLKSTKPVRELYLSIYTHTKTPATEDIWLAATEKDIAAANAIGINKARVDHRRWWKDFWTRSWIFATGDANAEAATRGYILQCWISACEGRGNFPIKFNGTIFTVNTEFDPDYRRWGGCYCFQNTRLPYWPMLASGDHDMMRPLFRMFLDALPSGPRWEPVDGIANHVNPGR